MTIFLILKNYTLKKTRPTEDQRSKPNLFETGFRQIKTKLKFPLKKKKEAKLMPLGTDNNYLKFQERKASTWVNLKV